MAKNSVYVDIVVDDKGTTKRVALNAKQLQTALEGTSSATQKTDRAMKGLSQQSANTTKNFSKIATLSGGIVPIYATLAAQVFAITAAFSAFKSAFEASSLIKAQEALTARTGIAYKSLANSIKEATGYQLGYNEASRGAAIGIAAGLSQSQLVKIGEAAKITSLALGRDLTDSYDRLIRGITKAEPEVLDELGIILRLKDATEQYAQAIGKNAEDLTTFERTQAVANNVLGQANAKFAEVAKAVDPAAFALNQFLASFDKLFNTVKTGLATGLAPIFTFLSENTLGLVSTLSLFALSITKQIVPNLKEWQETSRETLQEEKAALKERTARVKELAAQYKQLKDIEGKAAIASAKKTLAQGPAVTTGLKPTSGLSFLLGEQDGKRAQQNMDRILKGAEKQLRSSEEVKTGILKGYNARQVADLRASYVQRTLIVKEFTAKVGVENSKIVVGAKIAANSVAAAWKTALAGMQTAAVGAAKVMDFAFKAIGIVGLISLLFSLGQQAWDFFFPMSEAAKEAEKQLDSLNSSLDSLNDELKATAATKASGAFTSLRDEIIAVGNALQSTDITSKLISFFAVASNKNIDNTQFEELKQNLLQTLSVISTLSPEMEALKIQIEGLSRPELAKEETQQALARTSSAITELAVTAGNAANNTERNAQAVADSYSSLSGSLDSSLVGLLNLQSNLNTQVQDYTTSIEGMKGAYEEANNTAVEGIKEVANEITALESKLKDLEDPGILERIAGYFVGFDQVAREKSIQIQRVKEELAKLEKGVEEKKKNKREGAQQSEEEIQAATAAKKAAEDQQRAVQELIKTREAALFTRLRLEKSIVDATTLGITFEQRLTNLAQERLTANNQVLAAKEAITDAEISNASAQQSGDENRIRVAGLLLDQRKAELSLAESQAALDIKRIDQKEYELRLEQTLLEIKTRQREAANKVFDAELTVARLRAGIGLEAGQAGQQQLLEAQRSALRERQTELQNQLNDAQNKLTEAQNAVGKVSESELENLTAQVNDLTNKLASLGVQITEIDPEQRLTNYLRGLATETENIRNKIADFSFSGVQEKVNAAQRQAREIDPTIGQDKLDQIAGEIRAQEELNQVLQAQQELRSSIENNMTSAFTSIIDGTKSVKEAFADMAISILQDIAKIIAKQLMLKAISMAFPGFGFANGGVVPGGFRAFATGGVVKTPTLGLVGEGRYNEAVVPLPDGRSIPVIMGDKAGSTNNQQQNNVTVNVSMSQDGQATSSTQGDTNIASNLGNMVAAAVQKELQNQKRAGGILNRHGAA